MVVLLEIKLLIYLYKEFGILYKVCVEWSLYSGSWIRDFFIL